MPCSGSPAAPGPSERRSDALLPDAKLAGVKVKRAAKYGFCAGVRIADQKVKKFAAQGNSGHILGQVVHNERVVEEMDRLLTIILSGIQQARSDMFITLAATRMTGWLRR